MSDTTPRDFVAELLDSLVWSLGTSLRLLDPRRRARQRAAAQQVKVPYPGYSWRPEPGYDYRPQPAELPELSYTSNRVRLYTPGGVVDLVQGGAGRARPEDVGLESPLVIVSGSCPPSRRSTAVDNAASFARFGDAVERLLAANCAGGQAHRAVLFPRSRAWVEIGAAFSGVGLPEVREFVAGLGLRGFSVWEERGLRWEWAREDESWIPAPVDIRPVRPGCPMRLDGADQQCVCPGGPWIAASQRCERFWKAHQSMLVDAFGCGVCDPDSVGRTDVIGFTDLVQPSRWGGWDFVPGDTRTMARLRPKDDRSR
jgi:hypothetical protein